jgi:hypothetical protein
MPTLHSIISHQNKNFCDATRCHFNVLLFINNLSRSKRLITKHIEHVTAQTTQQLHQTLCQATSVPQGPYDLWSVPSTFPSYTSVELVVEIGCSVAAVMPIESGTHWEATRTYCCSWMVCYSFFKDTSGYFFDSYAAYQIESSHLHRVKAQS